MKHHVCFPVSSHSKVEKRGGFLWTNGKQGGMMKEKKKNSKVVPASNERTKEAPSSYRLIHGGRIGPWNRVHIEVDANDQMDKLCSRVRAWLCLPLVSLLGSGMCFETQCLTWDRSRDRNLLNADWTVKQMSDKRKGLLFRNNWFSCVVF